MSMQEIRSSAVRTDRPRYFEPLVALTTTRPARESSVVHRADEAILRIDSVLGSMQSPRTFRKSAQAISIYEESHKKLHEQAKLKLSFESPTKDYVDFLNTFYKEEGLPQDWQSLQYGNIQVGFSMEGQMNLLKGDDPESRRVWAKQTRQDLQGFVIEYLSPYIVYPWHHQKKENPDGSANLVDARYGGKKMVDTVSKSERGGTVKQVIEAIDRAVVNKKVSDGSIFVQWSPMDESPTGLVQDNGAPIVYRDTHLIVSQVKDDKLDGITIKTDLTQAECREMIRILTGRVIPVGAPIEDYIKAVALIDPTKGRISSMKDVVSVAADVRAALSFGSKSAYKDKSWDAVYEQIELGDKLYDFDEKMQRILEKFENGVLFDTPSAEELPEYIAATILRVSQEARSAEQEYKDVSAGTKGINIAAPNFDRTKLRHVLEYVAMKPGCAGGGAVTAVRGMNEVSRVIDLAVGSSGSSCPEIRCGGCSWKADEQEASAVQSGSLKSCPKCGWSPS